MKHLVLLMLATTGIVDVGGILFAAGLVFARSANIEYLCCLFTLIACCALTVYTLDLYGRSKEALPLSV